MVRRHAAPMPMPKKFSTNGSLWWPCFFIVTRLIAAHRLAPSAASIARARGCRRLCGPPSVSLRVQYALRSDVMCGVVENRIAVSPIEMRVSSRS